MTPREQAAALALLVRWRDLCLKADGSAAELEDDLPALMVLFLETEAFLEPGAPPVLTRVLS